MSDNEVRIPCFNVMRKDRKGDGVSVCIYVRTEFAYTQKTDLDFNN